MKTLTIEEECKRLCDDAFPAKNGGNTLTYRRYKEYRNFFFLGFRAAIGTVMMGTEAGEEEYQKVMDAKLAELDKYFSSEIAVETTEATD